MKLRKKDIRHLVLQSYTQDVLDEKKVMRIAQVLKRHQLKEYLKMLKNYEQQKSVTVVSAHTIGEEDKKRFAMLFPNKCIHYEIDTSLLVGIKIINNDIISQFNLKNTLDNLKAYTTQ